MTQAFVHVRIGDRVTVNNRTYEITHHLCLDSVLGEDVETRTPERIQVDRIEFTAPKPETAGSDTVPVKDLEAFTQEEWAQAQQRFEAIKPLVNDPFRTRQKVEATAEAVGVNVATIYEWLRLYQQSGHLSALIPRKRGRRPGDKRLPKTIEVIIETTIGDVYLSAQRGKPQYTVDEVLRRCKVAGLSPPHPNSVRNRIRELNAATVLRKRGRRDKARDLYEPIRGQFPGADRPLAVVQIDHTEADIIVVEEQTRLPMGRPWLTLAIDIYSRMVVGIYISMERPNAAAVGMCLARAMLPKREYLADLDIPGDWPVWGPPGLVHADNAKEFRGATLKRACEQYGIDIQMRPVRRPHYGGHVERLMGTSANEIRKLPGATFSSPKERKGYDSDKQSALTLREFEQHFVDFIVNVYHRRAHAELEVPPLRQWDIGVRDQKERPTGLPPVPANPSRLRLDFLPFVMRTVQPYGIVIDDIFYYHEVLNRWINAEDPQNSGKKREFIIRRPPDDISTVHFYDPEVQQYFAIPYRNTAHPPISVWELREARRRAKNEGQRHVDENAIFEAVERMRSRVEGALTKTRSARRLKHRMDTLTKKVGIPKAPDASASNNLPRIPSTVHSPAPTIDLFDERVQPFED